MTREKPLHMLYENATTMYELYVGSTTPYAGSTFMNRQWADIALTFDISKAVRATYEGDSCTYPSDMFYVSAHTRSDGDRTHQVALPKSALGTRYVETPCAIWSRCHYDHQLAILEGAYGCWVGYAVPTWGGKNLPTKPARTSWPPRLALGSVVYVVDTWWCRLVRKKCCGACVASRGAIRCWWTTSVGLHTSFKRRTQSLRANLALAKIGQKIAPISQNSKVGDFGDIVAKSRVSVNEALRCYAAAST